MSDIPSDAGPADESATPTATATDVPAFSDVLGGLSQEASDQLQPVANTISDWLGKQAIAARNTQAGQQVTDSINGFRDMMNQVVAQNPTATDMAVKAGQQVAGIMVNDHPYLAEEDKPGLADRLGAELGQVFARTGIMRAAESSADMASGMLDSFRHLFSDEHAQHLQDDIDLLEQNRAETAKKQQVMSAVQKDNLSFGKVLGYANSFVDRRGHAVLPPGYSDQTVSRDPTITADDSDLVHRLSQRATVAAAGGEAALRTRADDMMEFIQDNLAGDKDLGNPRAILNKAANSDQTTGVRLQDAVMLAKMATNQDDLREFGSVLGAAKQRLMGPDGDLGFAAGANARLDLLAHDLLVRYNDMGPAAFQDLPRDPAALLKAPGKLLGYQEWPALAAIFQRPQQAAPGFGVTVTRGGVTTTPGAVTENGVTVLHGSGQKLDVPGAQQASIKAEEDFASTTQRERARVRDAFQTMLPAEAQRVWSEAQANIEAARARRDQARQQVTDARREETRQARAERDAERAEARRARLSAQAEARQARAIAAAQRVTQARPARQQQQVRVGGGGRERAVENPAEQFARGARLYRALHRGE